MSTVVRHEPELLTVAETALELRRSAQTIRRWIRLGKLDVVRTPSGQLLIPIDALPRPEHSRLRHGQYASDRRER
jgi:predicted site-specific integrase-resolvase